MGGDTQQVPENVSDRLLLASTSPNMLCVEGLMLNQSKKDALSILLAAPDRIRKCAMYVTLMRKYSNP